MAYKKINLEKIASSYEWNDWSVIKSKANEESKFIYASNHDRDLLSCYKNVDKIKMSLMNILKNCKKLIHSSGKIIILVDKNFKFVRRGKKVLLINNNEISYTLTSLKAEFLCSNCNNQELIELNPSRGLSKSTSICKACQKKTLHKCKSYRKNFEKSIEKKYGEGIRYPLQSKLVRDKMKLTMVERYGVEFSAQSEEICKKQKRTNLIRYGRENYFSNINPWIEFKHKLFEKRISKLEINVVSTLTNLDQHHWYTCLNRQFVINDIERQSVYVVDMYSKYHNLVIEVYGNYWHANAKVFNSDHKFIRGCMSEIVEKDQKRIERVQSLLNCDVMIIWEQDWNNSKEEVIRKFNARIQSSFKF